MVWKVWPRANFKSALSPDSSAHPHVRILLYSKQFIDSFGSRAAGLNPGSILETSWEFKNEGDLDFKSRDSELAGLQPGDEDT